MDACATGHTVLIHDRGGNRKLNQVNQVAEVEWNRLLSDTSKAYVTLNARSCLDQYDVVSSIEPRRHELVIFRGEERVWEGPIVDAAYTSKGLRLTAKDVTEYLAHTPLSKAWTSTAGTLVTARIASILAYELTSPYSASVGTGSATRTFPRWENLTPPANVLPFVDVRTGTALTTAATLPFQMSVKAHMDDLAGSGLLYTTVGRRLLVWDPTTNIGRLRNLTENDFIGDVEVYADGTELDVIGHVSGARLNTDPLAGVGSAGQAHDFYGVWTRIDTAADESVAAATSLNTQAGNNIAGRFPVPLDIRVPDDAGLRIADDLPVSALVPGVLVPVRATLNNKEVSQVQRLNKVTVKETGGKGENVGVGLVRSAA